MSDLLVLNNECEFVLPARAILDVNVIGARPVDAVALISPYSRLPEPRTAPNISENADFT